MMDDDLLNPVLALSNIQIVEPYQGYFVPLVPLISHGVITIR